MKNCFKKMMLFCVALVVVITILFSLEIYLAGGFLCVVLLFSFMFAPFIASEFEKSS